MNDRADSRALLDAAATVALAVYSLVAAVGLIRVYGAWSFLDDAVAIVVVGHALSYLSRVLRVPSVLGVVLLGAVLVALAGWLVYPETYSAIFPSTATWDVAWADLAIVREEFPEAVAPVPYEAGWAMLGVIGVALVVLLGDTFAFRAHGRGEALVPGAVLFVFVAALGTDRGRVRLTLALVAAGFIAVAMLRVRFAKPPKTALGPTRHPLVQTLPAAGVAAAIVVLGSWAVGPRLPGAGSEAWIDTSGRGGGGVTEIVSPLIDIRSRLVNQTTTELFVVAATERANWRVSALPDFDGTMWGLPKRSLDDTRGDLTEARPGSTPNEQRVTITALGGRLVPAAADPIRVVEGEGLRYNEDTSTLVRTDRELEPGDEFTLSSAMPSFRPELLRAATSDAPPDPIYLDLPADFPAAVAELAATATASASNPYDQGRTLQDWFRTNFTYSLEVPSGHSTSAIEAFLERRTGYCEQFAGTFAAMARSLGLPARVAVGFTTGLTRADGAYSVLGKNAHAWPEVWFDGYGWVAFEPTPGRGAPGAQEHTGVLPEQDDTPVEGVTAGPTEFPVTSTTVSAVNGPDRADIEGTGTPDSVPLTAEGSAGDRGVAWGWLLVLLAIVAAVVAAPAVGRRLRRSQVPSDPASRIAELWARARRAIESTTGHALDPALTPLEQAREASPQLPVAAQSLRALAEVATAATYAPPGELADAGIEAHDPSQGPLQWCHEIERVANDTLTPAGRVRHYFTDWR